MPGAEGFRLFLMRRGMFFSTAGTMLYGWMHLGAEVGELHCFLVADLRDDERVRHDARVRRKDPIDVGPDLDDIRVRAGADDGGGVVGAVAAEGRGDAFLTWRR